MTAIPRVVSLVPSATETLIEWGVPPIAVTQYCEQPDYPTVGGTKNPELDAIVALAPDLVVMCTTENLGEHAQQLESEGLRIHAIDLHTLADNGPEMARLAEAVLRPEAGGGPWPSGEPAVETVRAFIPIWRRPWMTISGPTYGSTLLASIGVGNVFADHADWWPEVGLDEVAERSPEMILAPSEPYEFTPVHLDELAEIAPVYEVDGRDLFWWGVRAPAAVERLRGQLTSGAGDR
ncbi:MAG: cobalamin-binding protein [Actinomycetia bacterium]|nr:cobalamin-binding protein [Actinomycetes bacterium]